MPGLQEFFASLWNFCLWDCKLRQQCFITNVLNREQFFCRKSSDYAEDACVSKLCGSLLQHPVSWSVFNGLIRPSLYVALETNLIHMNLLAIFFNAKAMYKANWIALVKLYLSRRFYVCPRQIKCLKCVSLLYFAFHSHQSKCINYFSWHKFFQWLILSTCSQFSCT